MSRALAAVTGVAVLLLLLPSAVSASGPPGADVVFFGGTVVTMDRAHPGAEGLAIADGRIVSVGDDEHVLKRVGSGTEVVDLGGRTILPGFVDSHNHLFNDFEAQGLTLEEAQQLALSNGVTALGDMFVSPEVLATMKAFAGAGKLQIRTSLYPIYTDNCGEVQGFWFEGEGPIRAPTRLLRVPGIKIFADGGSCKRPAISWVYPPGAPGAGTMGDLFHTPEEILPAVRERQARGWQVAIHAAGDRGADFALDVLEGAVGEGENTLRHRIEHNTLLRDDQLHRYADIGVVPTIFGAFGTCAFNSGGFGRADLIPGTERYLWRWRDLVEANPGLRIAWSSDWPVFTIDPLTHLYGFVTRRQVAADGTICQPEPEQANDTIPVERALRMMTVDAAYALGQDSVIGTLRPGKLADFVVLSGNPVSVAPDDIPGLDVLVTMIGGVTRYCAAGAAALCP